MAIYGHLGAKGLTINALSSWVLLVRDLALAEKVWPRLEGLRTMWKWSGRKGNSVWSRASDFLTLITLPPFEHQPTVWTVSYACAEPYHLGSGSHGQLFRPCWALTPWHSHWAEHRTKSPMYCALNCRGVYKASLLAHVLGTAQTVRWCSSVSLALIVILETADPIITTWSCYRYIFKLDSV